MAAKLPKDQVEYGPGRLGERCSNCIFFDGIGACSKVLGTIDAKAWCRLFTRKAA